MSCDLPFFLTAVSLFRWSPNILPHPYEEVINLIKYFLYFSSSVQFYLLQLVTGWDTTQVCDSKTDAVTTASFSSWRALCVPIRICILSKVSPFLQPRYSRWLLLHPRCNFNYSLTDMPVTSLLQRLCPLYMDSSSKDHTMLSHPHGC